MKYCFLFQALYTVKVISTSQVLLDKKWIISNISFLFLREKIRSARVQITSALGQYRALIEIKDARFTEELREENFMMRLRYTEQRRRFSPQFSAGLRNARCAAYSVCARETMVVRVTADTIVVVHVTSDRGR